MVPCSDAPSSDCRRRRRPAISFGHVMPANRAVGSRLRSRYGDIGPSGLPARRRRWCVWQHRCE